MQAVCVWLTDRLDLQLHSFQLRTLITVVKVRPPPPPLPPPPPTPTSSLPSASAPLPDPTEVLPGLPSSWRPGGDAEQPELRERLQASDGGGGHSGGEGRRGSAGHQHEGQRRGGGVTCEPR